MKFTDRLYREIRARVPHDELIGVNRLIDRGHYGIAEKHGVHKLMSYVESLEKQLGIEIPETRHIEHNPDFIKINAGGRTFYQSRQKNATS